ncbi:DUF2267 domain-containing protein [Streptomyces sp. NPDC005963]|uniref:DUF2267 domain-containing protein n=1 Tax=Streptomyces sp. NPDC005963 TaxID=3156721 RepID=UPI0033F6E3D9
MPWQLLLEQVRYAGLYATPDEGEQALRAVLTVLGGQLAGEERAELAKLLPEEAEQLLLEQRPLAEPLSAPAFVGAVAFRLAPTTSPQARWATSTVLTLIAQCAGRPLTRRILAKLPQGHAVLFGHTGFTPTAAAA